MNALLLLLAATAAVAAPAEPRYARDARCEPAFAVDAVGTTRACRACEYRTIALPSPATPGDCVAACCGDWSCLAFRFTPGAIGGLSGTWANHDSLRGVSNVSMVESADGTLTAVSADPLRAFWSSAVGRITDATHLFLAFDGKASNNRSGLISPDRTSISFSRLPFDPPGWTQVFTLLGPGGATCTFMDDTPPPSPAHPGVLDVTGLRAWLPPRAPAPFPPSALIATARIDPNVTFGPDGDEWPTTWGDSAQYTGAGDNTQPSPGVPEHYNSPASFFAVRGNAAAPTFTLQGDPHAMSDGARAKELCPSWGAGLANIKSSGVLALPNDILFWAVSCFNYGDDPAFNRQRYGPAWIVASTDGGVTWDDASSNTHPIFSGRFAAPRFVQAGRSYDGAPDPSHVYALFPGTEDGAAFFECNDAVWLGRAPVARALEQSAWEYWTGLDASGAPVWDADATLAEHVIEWPLHVSVQQAVWHAGLQRFIAANWVWVSADGNPRPDHSPDERNSRTARQRTWLTLLEAPTLWGPWSVFHSDDDWRYGDDSSGAYTPIFPPAWINASSGGGDDSFVMVSTQCCGVPEYAPTNHYSWNAQRVSIERAVTGAIAATPPPPPPVDATTLQHKLLVGYQGWHATPNDGAHVHWQHWSNDEKLTPGPSTVHVDAWPDMREYPPAVLAPVNFTYGDGSVASLFSSQLAATTQLHFSWMAQYHIHGAFLQRFLQGINDPVIRAARDAVAAHVVAAAEAHGRVFALEYDVSGVADADIMPTLEADWARMRPLLTRSPAYLHHRGRPLLTVWGLGFNDDGHPATPATAARVQSFFQREQNVTLVGGVPTFWRTLKNDARSDPAWAPIYLAFDVLHPWLVGRFSDDAGADAELALNIEPDAALCRAHGVDYLPVVFPGFSWHNMNNDSPLNVIPRRGGTFLWRQLDNALRAASVDMLFGAMMDELDEGTALMKIAETAADVPKGGHFIYAGIDGDRVRSDWWLWLCGVAADALAGVTLWPGALRPPLPTPTTETEAVLAYAGLLARAPLFFELVDAASALAAGQGAAAATAEVVALCTRIMSSAEFVADALTPPALARQLYAGCLGVNTPDAPGLAATVAACETGLASCAARAAELVACGVRGEEVCPA